MSIDWLSAFIIGLVGSGHCIGMCGGISTMLTNAVKSTPNGAQSFTLSLGYHLGRISSYSFIGAIAGLTGSLSIKQLGMPVTVLQVIAGIFLILLGFYIGQWYMGLTKVEAIGKRLWCYLSPLNQKLLPVDSFKKSLGLGALWGWLPCGLVYSTLTWSIASGSAYNGAVIMCFFGLGTIPALLTVSFGIINLKSLLSSKIFRQCMATILIIYGIMTLSTAMGLIH